MSRQFSLLAAVLALVAASSPSLFASVSASPNYGTAANPVTFITIDPPVLTVKDNEPTTIKVKLNKNPGAAKPRVYFEAEGFRASTCFIDFDSTNYNVGKEIVLTPKPLFTAGQTEVILGAKLAWQADPDHTKAQAIKFQRNVVKGRSCKSDGDPHFYTFDNHAQIDFMGKACYYVVLTDKLAVQARHGPYNLNPAAAVNIGVAIAYGKTVWVIDGPAAKQNRLKMLSANSDGVEVEQNADITSVTFRFTDGAYVVAKITDAGQSKSYINIEVVVPSSYKGKTKGLCGPYDDNKENDMTKRDGSIATGNNKANDFGNSWALQPDEDIFAKGKDASIVAKLGAVTATSRCTLPTTAEMNAFGALPPPAVPAYGPAPGVSPPAVGYVAPNVQMAAAVNITPLPVVTVSKERTDAAFVTGATSVCKAALTIPGLEGLTGIASNAPELENCITDAKLGGSFDLVDSYRVSYQTDVYVHLAATLDKFQICAATGQPRPRSAQEIKDISETLGLSKFSCPAVNGAPCNGKGSCLKFGCDCNDGWTKHDCTMDLTAELAKYPRPAGIAAAPVVAAPVVAAPVVAPPVYRRR